MTRITPVRPEESPRRAPGGEGLVERLESGGTLKVLVHCVRQTIDGALKRIVQAGRIAGPLVNTGNIERYTWLAVRLVMTAFFPWIYRRLISYPTVR